MEDWEEVSDVESCRSSVISDIDELEANLYGIIHHEINEEVTENLSHELSVLPVSDDEGFWRTKADVSDVTVKDINNDKSVEFREENERCSGQKEKEVHFQEGRGCEEKKEEEQRRVNKDSSNSDKHDLSIEYADSRYNVGCANDYSKENIATTSSSTSKSESELSTPSRQEGSYPVIIDVLSSEEEQEVHLVNTAQSKKQYVEEVVVLDDSDSDVMIEMEKVNHRQKKRKKVSDFSDDIQLNTVNAGKVRRFDKPHFSESVDFQSNSPATNSLPTPVKELDLSTICKTWTPEMIHFYEESWGGENWTLNEVLSTMSDHGWQLDVTDQFSTLPGRTQDRRYFGNTRAWCTNCNRRGHTRNECPQEVRKQKCRRCGSEDHSEYNCKEKICLSCGKETKYFTKACRSCRSCLDKGTRCSICSVKGHISKSCPDLWRRYHATIVPGHVVCPKKVLYKSSMNLYCCNCATKGHHAFQCKKKTFGDYIPQSPKVIKYDSPSSPSRHTTRLAISENWDRRMFVPENGIKETPKSRRKDLDKSGYKLETPKENGNSAASKGEELGRTPIEYNNSAPSATVTTDPINPKKKKPKKKKTKTLIDQQNKNVNTANNPCPDQRILRIGTKPTDNCVGQLPSRKSSKMMLSNREYLLLKSKQGEEVLKYVSRMEPGTAVTLLHTGIKMLIFIGSKNSIKKARKLMKTILQQKEAWKIVTGSYPEVKAESKNKKKESPKVEAISIPNDLRVKIANQDLPTTRDVTCLPPPEPNYSQGPKYDKLRKKIERKKILSQSQKISEEVKSAIPPEIHKLLTKETGAFTAEKVRLFARWALRTYESGLNGGLKYLLRRILRFTAQGASEENIRKVLLCILKKLK